MRTFFALLAASPLLSAQAGNKDARPAPSHGKPIAPLHLVARQDKQFASALRHSYRQRANFAGYHVLTTMGCGAGCVLVAALDQHNGRVGWLPFTLCCWPESRQEPVEFRRDSDRVVLYGQRDEQGAAGPHYYRFHGGRFEPVTAAAH